MTEQKQRKGKILSILNLLLEFCKLYQVVLNCPKNCHLKDEESIVLNRLKLEEW